MQKGLYDYPLIGQAKAALRIQAKQPDAPVIEQLLFVSESEHEFAANYLALIFRDGKEPVLDFELNDFQKRSIKLARDVLDNVREGSSQELSKPSVRRDIAALCGIQQQVSTPTYQDHWKEGIGNNFLESRVKYHSRPAVLLDDVVTRRDFNDTRNRLANSALEPKIRRLG